jgi:hypothetical protein
MVKIIQMKKIMIYLLPTQIKYTFYTYTNNVNKSNTFVLYKLLKANVEKINIVPHS